LASERDKFSHRRSCPARQAHVADRPGQSVDGRVVRLAARLAIEKILDPVFFVDGEGRVVVVLRRIVGDVGDERLDRRRLARSISRVEPRLIVIDIPTLDGRDTPCLLCHYWYCVPGIPPEFLIAKSFASEASACCLSQQ